MEPKSHSWWIRISQKTVSKLSLREPQLSAIDEDVSIIRVAIVEDDLVVAELTGQLIDETDGMACCGIFASAEIALEKLAKANPDVILTDINLPGNSGIECVRELTPLLPESDFVMFTVFEDNENLFDALAAGASGYLLKRSEPREVVDAIRSVRKGESPMSGSIARKVVTHFHRMESARKETEVLSSREKEILDMLSEGLLYKEIADRLGIKIPTVNCHIRNIYDKLHVHSRSQAVAKFLKYHRD